MPLQCPSCDHALRDDELPRLGDAAKVLCPQCNEPLSLPEMTIPLSVASAIVESSSLDPAKRFTLVVLSGAQAGEVFEIDKPVVTLGRSGCDVVLNDPELSRRHAKIEIEGLAATLEDLGSTNGTFVGKRRVKRAAIGSRSRFRVGGHELTFVVEDA